jgi:transcriptional regulator with XRE-family HTH domain
MNIGFKIKKLREQKKWSQEMLSDHLKIGQTTLSNIENGCTDKIDFLLMDKICKLFEVDFKYFTEEKVEINFKNNKINGAGINYGTIQSCPENIIEQIKTIVEGYYKNKG